MYIWPRPGPSSNRSATSPVPPSSPIGIVSSGIRPALRLHRLLTHVPRLLAAKTVKRGHRGIAAALDWNAGGSLNADRTRPHEETAIVIGKRNSQFRFKL